MRGERFRCLLRWRRNDLAEIGQTLAHAGVGQRLAARRIRSSEPPGQRIPIIALTANVLPEDRQKCLDSGMDDCLAKPINRENLFAALARWLPNPQGSL